MSKPDDIWEPVYKKYRRIIKLLGVTEQEWNTLMWKDMCDLSVRYYHEYTLPSLKEK